MRQLANNLVVQGGALCKFDPNALEDTTGAVAGVAWPKSAQCTTKRAVGVITVCYPGQILAPYNPNFV